MQDTLINQSIQNQCKINHPKISINKIGSFFYIIYMLLPFFRPPSIYVIQLQTAAILFTIPYSVYAIIQIFLLAILLLLRFYNIKFKNQKKITCINLILIAIFILAILQHYLFNQTLVDLITRPFFLILYYEPIFKLAQLYLQIVRKNLKYYFLMWVLLLLFSASGYLLYSNYKFDASDNIFSVYGDALFNLLVLQSTANFPDVALPFYRESKMNYVFFVLVLVTNTMIISNIIIATSFNTFKQISQKQQIDFAIPKILLEIIKSKQKKIQQKQIINALSPFKLFLYQIINNQYVKKTIWLINLNLFVTVCYHKPGQFPQVIIIMMMIFSFIISLEYAIKFYIFPLKLIQRKPFLLYQLTVSLAIIIALTILLILSYYTQKYTYLSPYLVLFRIPSLLKPIFFFLFKNKIITNSGLDELNPDHQQDMSVNIRFTSRFIEVFFILFLVMMLFSAIGQMLFAGKIGNNILPLLQINNLNPDYVFMNFNSTFSSFATLFALMIVNNWNSIVQVYVVVFNDRTIRLFFIIYFMLGVLVAYNLVVASILDYVVKLAEIKQKREYQVQKISNKPKINVKNLGKIKKALINLLKKQLNSQNMSQSYLYKNKKSIQEIYIEQWNRKIELKTKSNLSFNTTLIHFFIVIFTLIDCYSQSTLILQYEFATMQKCGQ